MQMIKVTEELYKKLVDEIQLLNEENNKMSDEIKYFTNLNDEAVDQMRKYEKKINNIKNLIHSNDFAIRVANHNLNGVIEYLEEVINA